MWINRSWFFLLLPHLCAFFSRLLFVNVFFSASGFFFRVCDESRWNFFFSPNVGSNWSWSSILWQDNCIQMCNTSLEEAIDICCKLYLMFSETMQTIMIYIELSPISFTKSEQFYSMQLYKVQRSLFLELNLFFFRWPPVCL